MTIFPKVTQLTRKPMPKFPEDSAVHLAKHGGCKVGVLIEVCPSRKLPIQAFHDIHPVRAVIARQLLD